MYGRYKVQTKGRKGQSLASGVIERDLKEPRYNAAPSQGLSVITNRQPKILQLFSWGLQPFWAKDAKAVKRAINARSETLPEKPMFRNLLKSNVVWSPRMGSLNGRKKVRIKYLTGLPLRAKNYSLSQVFGTNGQTRKQGKYYVPLVL